MYLLKAPNKKQLNCLSTKVWINCAIFIQCNVIISENEQTKFYVTAQMNVSITGLSKRGQVQKEYILYESIYTKFKIGKTNL